MFLLTLLWNIGLLGILVTLLFILAFILKKYQLRNAQNKLLTDSIITEDERKSHNVLSERTNNDLTHNEQEELLPSAPKNPTTLAFKITNAFTSVFFYVFWIVVSAIYLTLYMFNTFGRGAHIDVLSVLALTCALVIPTLIWKYHTKVSNISELKGEIIVTIVLLLLWLGLSVFAVIATKGVCLCYFTSGYGFTVEKDLTMST